MELTEVNMRERVELPLPPSLSLAEKIQWRLRALVTRKEDRNRPISEYDAVNLTYWTPEGRYGAVNFGDELSPTIVSLMLARRGATLRDGVGQARQMLAVGSGLHLAGENAVIWGTGLHGAIPERDHKYASLDVRAVRGPLTRMYLRQRGLQAPEIYGDPGLLVPILTGARFQSPVKEGIGLVPNLHDLHLFEAAASPTDVAELKLISPLRSWNTVVEEIARCEFVVASSLHGLIIADAFGIPARYVRLSEREPTLKYEDYYEGTGRRLQFSRSIAGALDAGGAPLLDWDPGRLMQAFPYELWGL